MDWHCFGMNFSTTASQKEIEGVQPSPSEFYVVFLTELMNIMNIFFIRTWAQSVIKRLTGCVCTSYHPRLRGLWQKRVWCDVCLNCMRKFSIQGREQTKNDSQSKVSSCEMEFSRSQLCNCITMVLRPSKYWLKEPAGCTWFSLKINMYFWHVLLKPFLDNPYSINFTIYGLFSKILLNFLNSSSVFFSPSIYFNV